MKIQEIQALELRLAQNPKESNWKKLFSAMYYMGELQLRELGAIKEGESSLQIPQDNPYAWFATGRYAALSGAWTNAVDVYDRALALRPQDVPTMLWKAEAMARLGRLDEASVLFEHVGKTFAWPSRITRMGHEAWETIKKQAPAPIDESQWEWLVSPPKDVGTVVLVSLDGRYAQRYAESFLESWRVLEKQPLATEDRASDISGALHLHLHLVNADAATQALVKNWVLAAGQASLAYEEISLPALVQDDEINHAAEARTWYACARLRILPWWVERAEDGILITDVDVHFLRSPLELWPALGQGSAGAVRFNPSTRMLWEEWYMTLFMVRATPKGQEIANDLAAYVSYFLDRGDGFWVLDQAALWSAFAKHGGPIGHALPTRPDVVPLAPNWVRSPSSPAYPEAVIESSVASQQGNDLPPRQSPKTTEFSKALTYAQMWHRVMGQSLQKYSKSGNGRMEMLWSQVLLQA